MNANKTNKSAKPMDISWVRNLSEFGAYADMLRIARAEEDVRAAEAAVLACKSQLAALQAELLRMVKTQWTAEEIKAAKAAK